MHKEWSSSANFTSGFDNPIIWQIKLVFWNDAGLRRVSKLYIFRITALNLIWNQDSANPISKFFKKQLQIYPYCHGLFNKRIFVIILLCRCFFISLFVFWMAFFASKDSYFYLLSCAAWYRTTRNIKLDH